MRALRAILLILGLSISAFGDSLAQMDAIVQRAPNLDAFLSDPQLLSEYKKAVEDYYGTKRFQCQSFKQVIDDLKVIVAKIPWAKEQIWKRYDEKTSLLVMAEKGNVYGFRSVSRKLHAIWSYNTSDNCEASVCDSMFKTNNKGATVLMGRWSVVLSGSQVQLIEKNGNFTGMAILLSPYQQEEKTYGMVEVFGNPEIQSLKVAYRQTRAEKVRNLSLLEIWTQKFMQVRPFWVTGLLVPKKAEFVKAPNLKVMDIKANEGEEKNFTPMDPASTLLAAHLAGACSNNSIPLNTVLPVSSVNTANMMLLTPTQETASPASGAGTSSADNWLAPFASETAAQLAQQSPNGFLLNGSNGSVPASSGSAQLNFPPIQMPNLEKISSSQGPSASAFQLPTVEQAKVIKTGVNPLLRNLETKQLANFSGDRSPSSLSQGGLGSDSGSEGSSGAGDSGGPSGPGGGSNGGGSNGGGSNGNGGGGSIPPGNGGPGGGGIGNGNGNGSELDRLTRKLDRMASKPNPDSEAVKETMYELLKLAANDPKNQERAIRALSQAHIKVPDAGKGLFGKQFTVEERKMLNPLAIGIYKEAYNNCPQKKK